jgi:hypothetical protein
VNPECPHFCLLMVYFEDYIFNFYSWRRAS